MLIFVLQTIWLYIKELAGKDLDLTVVFKFLLYFAPKLIPLVLPLTILLASIMVFGSFAENYEFAAMKSTGISLRRAMSGLTVFITGLAILTFFFANNVIPWAEYNSYNLRKNIAKLKPAMVIAEGQFNDIGENFNIKVGDKSGDRGQYLSDVIIHKKADKGKGNHIIIVSKKGELVGREDSDILQLILSDGYYYDDTPPKKPKDRLRHPFTKSAFKEYTINVDLSQMNEVDLDEKNVSDKYDMLNIYDLDVTIDSLIKVHNNEYKDINQIIYNRTGLASTDNSEKKVNKIEGLKPKKKKIKEKEKAKTDVVIEPFSGDILDIFNTKESLQLIDLAKSTTKSSNRILDTKKKKMKQQFKNLNKHIIAYHEKLALGFACIILFFVGAPLGALIRKGGIGLPMVIAILLFLTYHFIGIFAKNSAEDGSLNPILASWFSTLIMLPLGVYFTKRATADKGLFEMGNYFAPLKKLFKFFKPSESDGNNDDFGYFKGFNNKKLIAVLKSTDEKEFSGKAKFAALEILQKRGMTNDKLESEGINISNDYYITKKKQKNFNTLNNYAMIFYIVAIVLFALYFVFENNKLPDFAIGSIRLSILFAILYTFYYVKSAIKQAKFFNYIGKLDSTPGIFSRILGFPLFIVTYIIRNNKVKEALEEKCLQCLK